MIIKNKVSHLSVIWLSIALLIISSLQIFGPTNIAGAATSGIVQRVYTDKSQYTPNSSAIITVAMTNNTGSSWSGNVVMNISHLETLVSTASQNITIANGQSTNVNFNWTTPATDFQGYFVRVDAGTAGSGASAIDVSSNSTKYPRYGYLSEFPTTESASQSTSKVNQMTQDYHLNNWQFYDWMWKHEKFIKRTGGTIDSTWQDLFDRTISWSTIQNQISAVHNVNAKAMAYAMAYTAREGYQAQSGVDPTWGLYGNANHTNQLNVDFGNGSTFLWMFDPQNVNWQNYIKSEYIDAVNTAGFDGIHVDQMGQRNNVYDYNGTNVDLSTRFSSLINSSKTALTSNNPNKNNITFNIVDGTENGWAANDVSTNANVDFLYSEIWYLSDSYKQLKAYIDSLRANGNNKAAVLAGYMNYGENIGTRYEAENAAKVNVSVNTDHPGYTGTGFIDQFASAGDSVEFTINAPEAGDYSLVFRYGNSTGSTSILNLYVDGVLTNNLLFDNQTNWDTWSHKTWRQVNLTQGTHTIKVKYDAPGIGIANNTGAVNLDSLTLGTFDDNSIRLADAMMAASGATHIELGDNNQMLAHEYYPDHSKSMRDSLKNSMKDHYNFITAYENLLFDANVTNNDSGTQFAEITGVTTSGDGTGNTVWNIMKRTPDYNIVHLINLLNNDNQWRNSAATPTILTNKPTKIYVGNEENISNVYIASPDLNHGSTQQLTFTTGTDAKGKYVSFTVPELRYWDMIYMKKSFTTPTNDIYEAETAIKANVTTNTNHTGYTGTGFVDQFTTTNDGVSFIVNVTEDNDYKLRFRYANGGSTATRDVYIDGIKADTVTFANTGNWDTWGYGDLVKTLKPGYHSIVLWQNATNTGAINLDHFDLDLNTSDRSITSLYMNNWDDSVNIWMASKLSQNDTGSSGPRIGEMRIASDYSVNQIKDYTSFFRDETNSVKYNLPTNFKSEAYYDDGGILRTKYLQYGSNNMPITVSKDFAMVPNEDFTVATFTLTNNNATAINYNLLEQIHANNKTIGGTNSNNHGWWDSARNTMFVDMSGSGQYYLALGAFQAADGHQVANDTVSSITQSNVAAWYTFDNNGTVKNNNDVVAPDISVAFQDNITIPANSSVTVSFVATVQPTLSAVQTSVDTARAQSASYWLTQTQTRYNSWLTAPGKKTVNFADDGIDKTFTRGLISIKNATNPTYGPTPAATNPIAYGYKVWARDSAVTAMVLDQAGFYAEAEKYWYWLADRQSTDGSFKTTFDYWTNAYVSFVEPEHDSMGIFLIGAYNHYKLTGDTTFLNNIWTKYKKTADFLWSNLGTDAYGFGVADASIWEEQIEYNAFSQGLFVAGLDAAQYMAKAKGLSSVADDYNGAASKIRSNIQKADSFSPKGLWNSTNGYYNRALFTNGTLNTLVDASSNALIVYGVVDAMSSRALSHVNKIKTNLQHDNYGVARYDGDVFYNTSPWSPAGNEALSDEPSWPQMSTYIALNHMYRGENSTGLNYLKWIASRTAVGYMSSGEAVSRIDGRPLISTAVEPVTAAWFVLGALTYEGKADVRILPPQVNAGAQKTITVTSNVAADLTQWGNVPYYQDVKSDSGSTSADTDIAKVYVSNDATNLYVRIKNKSGALSAQGTTPKFGMMVYGTDFKNSAAASKSTGINGGTLDRPMQYMVSQLSDGSSYTKYNVQSGNWTSTGTVTSVIAPQWSATSGDIEMVVPLSTLSSTGSAATGDFSSLNIVLARQNPTTSVWSDDDSIAIHYRVMTTGENWYYGNVE